MSMRTAPITAITEKQPRTDRQSDTAAEAAANHAGAEAVLLQMLLQTPVSRDQTAEANDAEIKSASR